MKLTLLLLSVLTVAGCASEQVALTKTKSPNEAAREASHAAGANNDSNSKTDEEDTSGSTKQGVAPETKTKAGFSNQSCGDRVHHNTNQDQILPEDVATLDCIAKRFKEKPLPLNVTGHADERGSSEFNEELGWKRANQVKRELIQRGLPDKSLRTASAGEDQPVDPAHNETAWAKNRRTEIRP